MRSLLLLLLLSLPLAASDQAQYILFAGGGWDHYADAGQKTILSGGVAPRIAENVYSWNTVIAKGDGAKLLSGFYGQVYSDKWVSFGVLAQIGGESTAGDVSFASATGGVVQVGIGNWMKFPALKLIGVINLNKQSNAATQTTAVKPAIGIGLAWHSQPK